MIIIVFCEVCVTLPVTWFKVAFICVDVIKKCLLFSFNMSTWVTHHGCCNPYESSDTAVVTKHVHVTDALTSPGSCFTCQHITPAHKTKGNV